MGYAKGIYAPDLELKSCVWLPAEIGENTGLYLYGFNPLGIAIVYILEYARAGITTLPLFLVDIIIVPLNKVCVVVVPY